MKMQHKEHGTAQCGDWQVDEFLALGWELVESEKQQQESDEVVLIDDEPQQEESLADLVDDRSIVHLERIGIRTVDDLRKACKERRGKVLSIPYVTRRTLSRIEGL